MAHNFADLFEHAVDAYGPDRLAVVEDDRRLTYAGLEAEANRWSHALSSRGVGPGDHVAVHLRNGVDCLALFLGILKIRAVPGSINYRYGGSELRYLYDYSDACALVFHREFTPLVTGAVEGLEGLQHLIVVDDGSGAGPLPAGAVDSREVLEEGILAMRPGNRLTDVSHALEVATRRAEERHGLALGIVDGYGGHGIGREMHEWPFLANEGRAGKGPRLQVGSVLAVEPMLVLGGETATHVLGDDWTVVTADGAPASHWEHTVAVTPDGPRILTPRP